MLMEMRSSTHAIFTTLTYAEGSLPVKLEYRDISLFLKSYRKSFPGSVRFFCCGEYGMQRRRPHWHLILFSQGRVAPTRDYVTTAWEQGFVHVGAATAASMAYVARYALKTSTYGLSRGLTPVARMSRRPGLGLDQSYEMGRYIGMTEKEVDQLPSWLRVGRRWYPLDRMMRVRMRDGFVNAGGVELKGRSDLRLDFEARMWDRVGGVLDDKAGAVKMVRARVREFERGAF